MAHALKTEVRQYLESVSPELSNLPCIVKMYANIDGLKNILFQAGLSEASTKLKNFARGFSQFGGSTAFIDVGGMKEQADHEIKGYSHSNAYSSDISLTSFKACSRCSKRIPPANISCWGDVTIMVMLAI